MAPPTSQLQDPRPIGSTVHHPLTAADVMTAAEVAALLLDDDTELSPERPAKDRSLV
jgi:hypothetical protein